MIRIHATNRKAEALRLALLVALAAPLVAMPASLRARSSTGPMSPPHLGEPGRGRRWTTPIRAFPPPKRGGLTGSWE